MISAGFPIRIIAENENMNTDSITLFLAIWGAFLGTVGAIISISLAVKEFKKDKHKIDIQAIYTSKDPFWTDLDSRPETYIIIRILNIGVRPIQITEAYLVLDNGKRVENYQTLKTPLPQKLEESEITDLYFAVFEINSRINLIEKRRTIWAYIVDGKGNKYKYRFPKSLIEGISTPPVLL
jgi:hypothetical protein